jgi:cation diffusion facilitator family transporter
LSHGSDSTKAIFYALAANGAIAVTKYIAAVITGSGSMLAEAVHSTADCGNQLLLLLGMKRAKKPPSDDYPLGYGKETYFWSFIVALLLFSMGGLFSIYEGWHKLHEPEPLSYALLALGVLGFGIIVEGLSLAGCMREINKSRGEQHLYTWFRQTREAELLVILGEDVAALLGLSFAFIAVLAAWITGNPMWDAIGSMGIGVLLIVVAFFIGIEVKSLLVGQGVAPTIREEMLGFLRQHPAIKKIYNLRTLHMGTDVMVAIKAEMNEQQDAGKLINDINQVEVAFRQRFEQVTWCFFEPDTRD